LSKDLFSKQAEVYAKYRPTYPAELLEYILSFTKNNESAWDCATGNGQAAVLLANYFKHVFATDISEKQLSHAIPVQNISYSTGTAEKSGFEENSFDLITVAQAYHWLRFEEFRTEVIRVARPGAVIAIWGYGLIQAKDEKLNNLIKHFYVDIVGKYWDPERGYIDKKYKTVPFGFKEYPAKSFSIHVHWDLEDLTGYLNTWSSVQHYIQANLNNPVEEFSLQLRQQGAIQGKIAFSFPLFLRLAAIGK
jgi:ubiquinone/menaquinone biosynthesis C-methylase UbiE